MREKRFFTGRKPGRVRSTAWPGSEADVGDIVARMAPEGVVTDLVSLITMLNRCSATLQPWAESAPRR